MNKDEIKKLIDTATGRIPAELVIKNCQVVDVFSGEIISGDIAFCGGKIAGVGQYSGEREVDGKGRFAAPGLIDSHIHVESSYLSPEELSKILVPQGTTAIIADPPEIANVCGVTGLEYMVNAGEKTALQIYWMLPSCVPSTPFEHSGAVLDADAMRPLIKSGSFLGFGEFMDYPNVIGAENEVLEKLALASQNEVYIDGHSPGVSGLNLNAYAGAGIRTDHECSTVEEMQDRISRGMYVLMRQGSACHNLRTLLKGVTNENSRRCLLCTDDCQPSTIRKEGHLNNHLRICVEEGLNAVTAIRMASLNAAECYGLKNRGAIAPGYWGDIVLFDDLVSFNLSSVFIGGVEIARNKEYLRLEEKQDIIPVRGSFYIKDFSKDKLKLRLKADKANVIGIIPGGVVTKKEVKSVTRNQNGDFVFDPQHDIVKIAVVERHKNTGNVATALLGGYGIKAGAIALSVAHDSHNVITTGVSDEDMFLAVQELTAQDGGIVLVKDGQVIERMPMPIAGLMTDQNALWVEEKLSAIHTLAHDVLGISREVEPIMTLCFMSLPVIPSIKITDSGLFDVETFKFISVDPVEEV